MLNTQYFDEEIFNKVVREVNKKSNHYRNYLHRLEQIKRIKQLRENPLNVLLSKFSKKNIFLM